MATTSRGRAQDRGRVAGGQSHEVRWEGRKEPVKRAPALARRPTRKLAARVRMIAFDRFRS
ncbi:DUF3606 domain-containing protein [Rhizobium sp. BK529]|uniref:DUF3606 domain-containing protein n=1 Tax=Rhizobium sp. BK529 TaxID=2586983 RepID=UPI0039184D77